MMTWRRGVKIVADAIRKEDIPLDDLIRRLEAKNPTTVRGTAIYLTRHPEHAPAALLHCLKHFKVMHERVAVLVVHTARVPRVRPEEAVKLTQLSPHFWSIEVSCGFMETPNIPKALEVCSMQGWAFELMDTSFVLSRLSIKPDAHAGRPLWQDHLFITLSKNAEDATEYFSIPRERVVELGAQVSV
jgi:KUP system potassium uptake protein